MARIDWGRVILGGIVAGIVIDVINFVLNAVILAQQWRQVISTYNFPAMGGSGIVLFNIAGLLTGLAAVWTYAAIRPRFGAGPWTAVYAAVLTWVTAYVVANSFPAAAGVLPSSIILTLIIVGLAEIIVATLAGAYLYRETA